MLKIFKHLNPINFKSREMIFSELDEISKVIFFTHGSFKYGFEINKGEHFFLQDVQGSEIGIYECSFNKRSVHLHKASNGHNDCGAEGYFIRKHHWKELDREYPYFVGELKK